MRSLQIEKQSRNDDYFLVNYAIIATCSLLTLRSHRHSQSTNFAELENSL